MTLFTINPPNVPIADANLRPTNAYYRFFVQIQRLVGDGRIEAIQNAQYLTYAVSSDLPNGKMLTQGSGLNFSSTSSAVTVALSDTLVVPGIYGNSGNVAAFDVDQKGRIVGASNVPILPASIGAVPTSRTITAGGGLTGTGDLSADRTLAVGAGVGITVNADDVAAKPAGSYGTPTGTLARAIFATYTAPTISAIPTQAEVQAVADALQVVSRTLGALITDMQANGNLS